MADDRKRPAYVLRVHMREAGISQPLAALWANKIGQPGMHGYFARPYGMERGVKVIRFTGGLSLHAEAIRIYADPVDPIADAWADRLRELYKDEP
jgi:hypothetical protein